MDLRMGWLSRSRKAEGVGDIDQHQKPVGCLGTAIEVIFYGDESDEAFLGEEPRDESVKDARAYTAFACPGLTLKKLNRTVLDGYYESEANAAYLTQVHVREATAFIAGACATCELGPAAMLREDAAIRKAAINDLENKIELAQLEVRRLELLAELGQQAIEPSPDAQLDGPQIEASPQ